MPLVVIGAAIIRPSGLGSLGDGRPQGRIPAAALLWTLLMGALVRSPARRALDVSQSFGNDALGYFTERLDPSVTRQAAVTALH